MQRVPKAIAFKGDVAACSVHSNGGKITRRSVRESANTLLKDCAEFIVEIYISDYSAVIVYIRKRIMM